VMTVGVENYGLYIEFPATRIDEFFLKIAFDSLFTSQIRTIFFANHSIILPSGRGLTMQASMSKVAQVIELSYKIGYLGST
jgi:hypothetical protein